VPSGSTPEATEAFVRQVSRDQLYVAPTVGELLALLDDHVPRVEPKWIGT
jgi:hypothetical protein